MQVLPEEQVLAPLETLKPWLEVRIYFIWFTKEPYNALKDKSS